MLRPLLTVALLCLGAATGCGSGGGTSSPRDAVRSFNAAVADGDGERACELLAPAAREELKTSTQGAARESCTEVIEKLAAFYDDATKSRLRSARVEASAEGGRATARFTSPTSAGGPDAEQTYELVDGDDGWRIESLGLTPADPALEPLP